MEMRQLRYFTAVADELSFTRAAQRLHVSQPPLSRQISNLEGELGVQLLHRDKHRVALTEAGRMFLGHAKAILRDTDTAAGIARRAAQGEIGRLVLAFGGSAALSVMPEILKNFRIRYPEVTVELEQLPLTERLDALRSRRVDVGYVLLPFGDRTLSTELMVRDPLVLAVPQDHALAEEPHVRLKQIQSCDFVAFPRTGGLGYHSHIVDICRGAGFVPRIVRETAPMESVIGLVASGLGIAMVPSMARRLRLANVVYVPIKDKRAYIDFAFAWNKENRSPVLHAFLAIARDVSSVHEH